MSLVVVPTPSDTVRPLPAPPATAAGGAKPAEPLDAVSAAAAIVAAAIVATAVVAAAATVGETTSPARESADRAVPMPSSVTGTSTTNGGLAPSVPPAPTMTRILLMSICNRYSVSAGESTHRVLAMSRARRSLPAGHRAGDGSRRANTNKRGGRRRRCTCGGEAVAGMHRLTRQGPHPLLQRSDSQCLVAHVDENVVPAIEGTKWDRDTRPSKRGLHRQCGLLQRLVADVSTTAVGTSQRFI